MSKYAEILKEENQNRLHQYLHEEEHKSDMDYDKVFKAVFAYYGEDPDAIDDLTDERRKEIMQDVDQCWDEEENKVPDSCPIDLSKYV